MPMTGEATLGLGTGKTEQTGGQDSFQQLLDSVLQASKPAAKPAGKTEKPTKTEQKQQTQETATEPQPDAAASLAGAQAQQAAEQPQADAAAAEGGEQAQAAQPVTQQVVMQVQTAPVVELPQTAQAEQPQQTSGGDILSAQVTTEAPVQEAQSQQAAPTQTQTQPQTQTQDRFGEMLTQATQELQNIVGANAEADTAEVETPQATQPELLIETVQPEAETPEPEAKLPTEVTIDKPEIETETAKPQTTRVLAQPQQVKAEQKQETSKAEQAAMDLQGASKAPEPVRMEAPRTQEAQPQRPQDGTDQMEQVHQKLVDHLEQLDKGRSEFVMQLQPEELGKVSVKLVLESGRLAVEIAAASPKAAELLNRQAENLMQSMRLQSIEVDTVHVVTESETASGQMHGAFNMMNGQAQNGGEQGGEASFGRSGGQTGHGESQPETETTGQTTRAAAPETLLDYAV